MVNRQFLSFLWIGGLGFAVDGGALLLLSVHWTLNIYVARVIAFFAATYATWMLNRAYTFRDGTARDMRGQTKAMEYARYVSVQLVGGLINVSVFSICIFIEPDWRAVPLLPLAVGSACGLLWNYTGAKLWAFK